MMDEPQQPDTPASPETSDRPIFISYSRANSDYARHLYDQLAGLGFTMWRDRSEMEAGKDWWQQIQGAIRSAGTVVLLMSPAALSSPTVSKEWRYARQIGTRVIPVLAEDVDFQTIPRWMARIDWLDFRETAPERDLVWGKFVRQLRMPYRPFRVPFTVPELSPLSVQRSAQIEQLLGWLLDERHEDPQARLLALVGGAGFGKTTVAQELCYNDKIQQGFSDGILWISLGEHPNVLGLLLDQIELISGERPGIVDVNAASKMLDEVISEREMLLVLDDAWQEVSILPFVRVGKMCAKLITTRRQDMSVLVHAQALPINEMQQDEATQVLLHWLDVPVTDTSHVSALATDMGEWPLLLSLAGAYLRELITVDRLPFVEALGNMKNRLASRGFAAFDRTDEQERNRAISISLELSLERLGILRVRYLELTIFASRSRIPFATVAHLWSMTAGMSTLETEDALIRMQRLSLFMQFDASERTFGLHEVLRLYLQTQLADAAALHAMLIKAWGDPYSLPDHYAWRNLAYHLVHAGRIGVLNELLLDFAWLTAKLTETDIGALVSDYDTAVTMGEVTESAPTASLSLIRRALQLGAHVLAGHKDQLWYQLYGRLASEEVVDSSFVPSHPDGSSYLMPLFPNYLTPQSRLLRTMVGHFGAVLDIALTKDGKRIASVGTDGSLRVWEFETGQQTLAIDAHKETVRAVVFSPDGRFLATGGGDGLFTSYDTSIKVWDASSGKEIVSLVGHEQPISGLAVTADSRYIVSGSWDQTIRIWDVASGSCIRELRGHTQGINAVALSSDNKHILSGASDGYAKLWDFSTGAEIRSIELFLFNRTFGEWLSASEGFHPLGLIENGWSFASYVLSVAFNANGTRFVAGSSSGLIAVGDIASDDIPVAFYQAHTKEVLSLAFIGDDDKILSSSRDRTICVWTVEEDYVEREQETIDEYPVHRVAMTANGQYLASTSGKNVKLWMGPNVPFAQGDVWHGHQAPVTGLAVDPGGRFVLSVGKDRSVAAWDLTTGAELRRLDDAGDDVVIIPPDRFVSVSANSFKIWEVDTFRVLKSFPLHLYVYSAIDLVALRIMSHRRLAICSRSGQWTEVLVCSLDDGKTQYRGRFGYEDEGWEMFRVMAGFTEPPDSEIHDQSYSLFGILPDDQIGIVYVSHGNHLRAVRLSPSSSKGHKAKGGLRHIFRKQDAVVEPATEDVNFAWPVIEARKRRKGVINGWLDMDDADTKSAFSQYGVNLLGVTDLVITPTGTVLLGRVSGNIDRFDLKTGATSTGYTGHTRPIRAIRSLDNGERIVSVSDDATIRVWDTASARCVAQLTGLVAATQVEVTSDGRYLYACSSTRGLDVWDLEARQHAGHFVGESPFSRLALSPNGRKAIVGEVSGRIHLLSLVSQT